jgi:hypothetical protein
MSVRLFDLVALVPTCPVAMLVLVAWPEGDVLLG